VVETWGEAYTRLTALRPGPTPDLDARCVLSFVLGVDASLLLAYSDRALTAEQVAQISALLLDFQAAVPVAYLLGRVEFWSLDLTVTSDTLIPRPETESLVAWCCDRFADQAGFRVLDLGTGSGAIALALAHERSGWCVVAADCSAAALAVAVESARRLGLARVEFCQGDWYAAVPGRVFDLIVSNPPYLAADDVHLPDLQYEPRGALVAEASGLAACQAVIAGARAHLQRGGWLVVEHGCEQGLAVQALFLAADFQLVETGLDLAGLARFTLGCCQ
jgi:release factor glutamine methyltransferase